MFAAIFGLLFFLSIILWDKNKDNEKEKEMLQRRIDQQNYELNKSRLAKKKASEKIYNLIRKIKTYGNLDIYGHEHFVIKESREENLDIDITRLNIKQQELNKNDKIIQRETCVVEIYNMIESYNKPNLVIYYHCKSLDKKDKLIFKDLNECSEIEIFEKHLRAFDYTTKEY